MQEDGSRRKVLIARITEHVHVLKGKVWLLWTPQMRVASQSRDTVTPRLCSTDPAKDRGNLVKDGASSVDMLPTPLI